MQEITRGQRLKLGDIVGPNETFVLDLQIQGPFGVDWACFAVDGAGKVAGDPYTIFYNQLQSPCSGIRLKIDQGAAQFTLGLQALPARIERLVFTATVDGEGVMSQLRSGSAALGQGDAAGARFQFAGSDFAAEKAMLVTEIYRKDGVWRISALGQGFNGGFAALLKHFGGELADQPAPAPAAAPQAPPAPAVNLSKGVRLEKELSRKAPALVNLAKTAGVTLEKKGLGEHKAKVCMVLDVSLSMSRLYKQGVVQQVADRLLALACWFDDDQAVDVFLFDDRAIDAGPINLDNFTGHIEALVKKHRLGGGTDYAPVMNMVRKFYDYGGERNEPTPAVEMPIYVLFVTDGGCSDKRASERTMREAAFEPIFWQFVGVGGARFDFLEKLDDLQGRFIDNADFGDINDPSRLSDQQMYERLMKEYPDWVRKAKGGFLLRP